MLSAFPWRSGRTDLTADQRWEFIGFVSFFVAGLFQIWVSVFHIYNDHINL